MTPAQVHLALNHLPILVLPIGLLLVLWGGSEKNAPIRRAGLVLLLVAALGTLPVYFSGEGAEEIVEQLPGVPHQAIEEHEEAGKWALILQLATGFLAAVTLFLGRGVTGGGKLGRLVLPLLLLVGLITAVVTFRTGHLGGQIRHEEIRTGFKS